MVDTYKTIKNSSEGIFKEKGSKFLAFAYPVLTEEEVKNIIAELKKKYHDARHHCFAYKIGSENFLSRINDDGEPSGTAGKPIFGQIMSFNLTDVLIVVVRYFGGVLLGTGGLTSAYKSASIEALKNAEIIEKTIQESIIVKFGYEKTKEIERFINLFQGKIVSQKFEEICTFEVTIRKSMMNDFISKIFRITHDFEKE